MFLSSGLTTALLFTGPEQINADDNDDDDDEENVYYVSQVNLIKK